MLLEPQWGSGEVINELTQTGLYMLPYQSARPDMPTGTIVERFYGSDQLYSEWVCGPIHKREYMPNTVNLVTNPMTEEVIDLEQGVIYCSCFTIRSWC